MVDQLSKNKTKSAAEQRMNPICKRKCQVNQHVMAMEKLAKDFLVGEGYMPVDI